MSIPERLVWERDGAHWPHHSASRFVSAGGLRWHVQRFGPQDAPAIVLLHGTGAACHSWRALAPLLAREHAVLAMDLPGHGFTTMPPRAQMSLPGMAEALAQLLDHLGCRPALLVGHSAGAAIAVRMALDGRVAPQRLVALNGALLPLHGIAGRVYTPIARLLAMNPLVPRFFARRASDRRVLQRLIDSTGSRLDETGVALYGQLVASPGHAAAALAMMAAWELDALAAALPGLKTPLQLIVGDRDTTVPPALAQRVQALVPGARLDRLPGLGHLAHEERPDAVERLIRHPPDPASR